MKFLQSAVLFLLLLMAAFAASATTLTVTGTVQFSSLDGSADDSDPAPGVFAYNGNLVVDGTITCNDDPPRASAESACPISIRTTGDLTLDAGSAIYAENRLGTGNGGNITLDVGGNLTLHGPDGSLPGAVVSSSRTSSPGPQNPVQHAGNLQITVAGSTTLEAGSILAASAQSAPAGSIQIAGQGPVTIGGLVASGPSRTLLSSRFSGAVLSGGVNTEFGGPITITSASATGPGIAVTAAGVVVSQGEGAGKVQLEACGLAVRGLVVSLGRSNGAAQVVLRSGKDILVDGEDLLSSTPAGSRLGRVRADSAQGGTSYRAALYAHGDIQVLGPAPGPSTLPAVSADPSSLWLNVKGGTITAISLAGAITAAGNAFEAGIPSSRNQGGTIDLRAQGEVQLAGATLKAVGDYITMSSAMHGGTINVRSYAQEVSWINGIGDVRPVGAGVPAAARGTITVTYCTGDALTGTQFPTVGTPVQPFPVETQTCADAAPTLPAGEPALPSCANGTPPTAVDDAYTTDQGKTLTVPAPGVLANDVGTGLTATPQNAAPTAQGGTVTLNADGSFTYTPPAGFGSPPDDSFTYTVTNAGGSASATVRITVTANAKPTVQSTVPTNGAGNVSAATTITINFSEPVNVTSSAFRLECPSGTSVPFTVTPASPASSFVLHPTSPLPGGATCTVTVVAAQVTDVDASQHPAADYVFSFSVALTANDDLYPETVIGNVGVDSSLIPYSVTANDSAPSGATITAYDSTTAHGGTVVMTTSGPGIGRFTYIPPAGYQGADSFHYTLTSGASSATATVNLNVLGILWFINNNAVAGDGRLTTPFNSLAAFQSVNNGAGNNPGPNHNIFLSESGTDYVGPITLLAGQKLIGQDATASLAAIAGVNPGTSSFPLPATNSANSVIVRIISSGNGINLGQNNTIRGLTVGNTTGTAIAGTGFGTLTVADVTVSTTGTALDLANGTASAVFNAVSSSGGTHNVNLSNLAGTLIANGGALSGSTGTAFNVDQGTANVTYAGSITSGVRTVSITNRTGGTVTLSGAISETGTGIYLNANTGSTITFSGAITASTGANPAFTATGGGTVNATGAGSTLSTTTATALNVANTTIGASGLTFQSISAGTSGSGPASGIVLDHTTGSSGGLAVTGTGAAGSGGTIQKATGPGIALTSTANVSLSSMNVRNGASKGLLGTDVTSLALHGSSFTDNGVASTDDGIQLNNLLGTVAITGTTVTGSAHNNVFIDNTSGTLASFTLSGGQFASNGVTFGNDGILFRIRGTAVVTSASLSGATFSGNQATGLQVLSGDTGSIAAFTVSGNTFTDNNIAIDFEASETSSLGFKVLNNTAKGSNSHAINVFTASGAGTGGTVAGRIMGNVIGDPNVAGSGSAIGNGIRVNINGGAAATVLLDSNTIRQCPNGRGIEVIGRNGTGGLDATVTNNDVNPQDTSGFPLAAIFVQSNCVSICNTVHSDVTGNTVPSGTATGELLPTFIALVKSGASTLDLVDTPPASSSCTAQLTSTNTGSASASSGCVLIGGPINTVP
jgi:methionine-rich copper-binding protein CopC